MSSCSWYLKTLKQTSQLCLFSGLLRDTNHQRSSILKNIFNLTDFTLQNIICHHYYYFPHVYNTYQNNCAALLLPLSVKHYFHSHLAFSRWLAQFDFAGRTETGRRWGTEGLQTEFLYAGTASSEQRKTDPRTAPPSSCTETKCFTMKHKQHLHDIQ